MADKFWKPSSTSWADTNNWAATQNGATGAGVPVNTNDVYIYQGAKSIDASDQSAVTLNSMSIQDGWGGNQNGMTIGDSANALKINVTNAFTIQSKRASSLRFDGNFGTLDLRRFFGGTFYYQGTGTATSVRLGPSGFFNASSAAKVLVFDSAGAGFLIADDSSSPIDLVLTMAPGSSGECQRKIHTAVVGGNLKLTGAATGTATTGTSRWFVLPGGVLDIQSSGDINEIHALPGSRVTGENGPGYGPKPTLTVIQHEGADVRLPTSLYTVTIKPAGVLPGAS